MLVRPRSIQSWMMRVFDFKLEESTSASANTSTRNPSSRSRGTRRHGIISPISPSSVFIFVSHFDEFQKIYENEALSKVVPVYHDRSLRFPSSEISGGGTSGSFARRAPHRNGATENPSWSLLPADLGCSHRLQGTIIITSRRNTKAIH